jgi:hypothetical protein
LARRIFRWLFALVVLVFGVTVVYITIPSSLGHKDVAEYWASGTLLLHHANPYDEAGVFLLEKEAVPSITRAQIMFNPPCALPFTLPLGLFSVRVAALLWTLMILACLMLSTRILRILHGRGKDRLHLLVYVFAPALACLSIGQIVPLAMLGLVLFLWLQRDRPLLAGLCIPLLAVKPHLLLPFAAVVLLWTIKGKRYRFLVGVLASFAGMFGIVLSFDHQIFAHYLPVLRSANTVSHELPNWSSLFQLIHPQAGYLQYVPAICASIWAVAWYLSKGDDWDWNNEGLLVMVVSVVVAPYSWFQDEILMVPAVLGAIYRCSDCGKSLIGFFVLDGAALALILFSVKATSGAYLWTSLAWLGWVLYARAQASASNASPS